MKSLMGFVLVAALLPTAGPTLPAGVATASSATFVDSFSGINDTDPLYGLNVGLDQRETGTAKASYTRLSGSWNGGPAPAPWYVQVNHPAHPNTLSFWDGTSAVMLGVPAAADAGGHYTVHTTVDPVVGDTASGDWVSLMFARSRSSAGYVTNGDVDLGLTIRSSGGLGLFAAGRSFWTSAVASAGRYDVSMTVSTGADRRVDLMVNGTAFSAVAPAGTNRWPSTPYLYLGAYLSTSTQVSTFGSLSLSPVDPAIASDAKVFADTFDGATDTDPTGYGLNDGLRGRQPTVLTSGYTRTSGLPNSSASPAAWQSQVNHPAYPDRLSFWTAPSAIRLNKPVTAGLDKRYTVHAVVDPVANGNDQASPEWVSVMLSASAADNGYPTTADTDLGLTVRSSGRLQLYQHGTPTWTNEPAASPAANGTFDVTITAAIDSNRVTLVVNGTTWSITAGAALPHLAYLSLGSYNTDPNTVSTVDDLRVSSLGGLGYYGYFDVMDPGDHADHSSAVAAYTNLNLYLEDASPHPYLDYCRPHSCMFNIQWQQFAVDPTHTHLVLRADSAANVAAVRADIGANLDKVGFIYLIDEPYGDWDERRVSAADLQTATDQVRQTFPGMPLMLTLDGPSVVVANPPAIPSQIDLVGFDWYCSSASLLASTLQTLQARLDPYQRMYLIPESSPIFCPTTDSGIATRQSTYRQLAAANPRVVYLMNFGWWLGGIGEPQPFANLPATARAQQAIGDSVVNPALTVSTVRTRET